MDPEFNSGSAFVPGLRSFYVDPELNSGSENGVGYGEALPIYLSLPRHLIFRRRFYMRRNSVHDFILTCTLDTYVAFVTPMDKIP